MSMLRMSSEQYAALQRRAKKLAGEIAAKQSKAAAPPSDRYPDMLAAQIAEAGMPAPQREYRWHPTRRFRADLAWVDRKFIVEVDGAVHRMKDKFARDIERHNLLIRAGYLYIRVTPAMVRSGEALQWVKEFLA